MNWSKHNGGDLLWEVPEVASKLWILLHWVQRRLTAEKDDRRIYMDGN